MLRSCLSPARQPGGNGFALAWDHERASPGAAVRIHHNRDRGAVHLGGRSAPHCVKIRVVSFGWVLSDDSRVVERAAHHFEVALRSVTLDSASDCKGVHAGRFHFISLNLGQWEYLD